MHYIYIKRTRKNKVIAERYMKNNQIVLCSHKYESKLVTKSLHVLLQEIRLPLWPWQLPGGHTVPNNSGLFEI